LNNQNNKAMNNKIAYLIAAVLLLHACQDADNFYGVLDTQPEIVANYNPVYMIGDTLTIKGRLNPENNLEIRIGDVKADALETTTEKVVNNQNGLVLDVVKVRITEAMGIGEGRPITITSAGFTINIPSIEIVGDANASILDKQLQLVKVADMPAGSTPLYCRNGNGNVYAWNNTSKVLFRIDAADGSIMQVFTKASCMDARGAFAIAEFNVGAVSPDERYFYFSAKVTETAQDRTLELYKLCRFDLHNNALTTLNRTEYSLLRSRRTLAAAQPFEGNVDKVKIYKITAIWPDAAGNIYCNLMDDFLSKLDNQGAYSYLLDFSVFSTGSTFPNTDANFIPLINDPNTGEYYSSIRIHNALPGTKINYGMSYLDTEALMLYTKQQTGTSLLRLTDMATLIQTGEYINIYRQPGEISYATASLKRFNGGLTSNVEPLPLNGKLLGLYFQTTESRGVIDGGTLCEIDFENQKATRYAPNTLLFNGFTLTESGINGDRLLDYDAEGMLYMTANNSSVIVKTAYTE
jgi:hypothetical protein